MADHEPAATLPLEGVLHVRIEITDSETGKRHAIDLILVILLLPTKPIFGAGGVEATPSEVFGSSEI